MSNQNVSVEISVHEADAEMRWGKGAIDLSEKSLPALKALRVLSELECLANSATILDFGCGEGKMLNTIKKWRPDLNLFGVDVQAPIGRTDDFVFELLSPGQKPFQGKKFDAVLALDVIEHVPDPRETLFQIAEMLGKNGTFVGFAPLEGKRFSPFVFFRMILGNDLYAVTKGHIQAFSESSLSSLIGEKFQIQRKSYSYHFFGTLFDSVFFATLKIKRLSKWFWSSNSIYNPENKGKGYANRLVEFLNFLCFIESTFFAHSSFGSSGMHWSASPKKDIL